MYIYIYISLYLSFCVLFIQLDTDRYRQIQILTWIQTKKNKVAVEKKQPSPLQVGQTSMARCPKPRFSLKLCPCPKLKLWRLHGKVPTARSPRQGHAFQAELEPKAKKNRSSEDPMARSLRIFLTRVSNENTENMSKSLKNPCRAHGITKASLVISDTDTSITHSAKKKITREKIGPTKILPYIVQRLEKQKQAYNPVKIWQTCFFYRPGLYAHVSGFHPIKITKGQPRQVLVEVMVTTKHWKTHAK